MTSFDGRSFEFFGEVGAYYNVISEKQHQVTHRQCPVTSGVRRAVIMSIPGIQFKKLCEKPTYPPRHQAWIPQGCFRFSCPCWSAFHVPCKAYIYIPSKLTLRLGFNVQNLEGTSARFAPIHAPHLFSEGHLEGFCMQMTMKLKLGQMWDHNGTYMEGVGFRYQDHKVIIELSADDDVLGESLYVTCDHNKARLT